MSLLSLQVGLEGQYITILSVFVQQKLSRNQECVISDVANICTYYKHLIYSLIVPSAIWNCYGLSFVSHFERHTRFMH